ncbi:MAG TPA: nuclear transport factor 2 family protein [Acidimicrobiia bacterium]|nr:nuclear transport factor 2 family protein [Acidimicrobiia bacterium]
MSLESELLEIEEAFWESSGDADFWRENFSEEGVIALPIGLMGKKEVIRSQKKARPWSEFAMKDASVVDLGDDVASITYRAMARRDDESDYSAMVTSVYARRNGEWQLMVHQQTPTEV